MEYAGDYSDMLRQWGGRAGASDQAAAEQRASATKTKPVTRPLRPRGTRERDLAGCSALIEALAGEISRLEGELADPDRFRRDPEVFAARTNRLARAHAEREAAEERWLDPAARQERVT